ncbi:hypothetical protein D3C87_1989190 [compost metagenome]
MPKPNSGRMNQGLATSRKRPAVGAFGTAAMVFCSAGARNAGNCSDTSARRIAMPTKSGTKTPAPNQTTR